jgi:hypothetical protein
MPRRSKDYSMQTEPKFSPPSAKVEHAVREAFWSNYGRQPNHDLVRSAYAGLCHIKHVKSGPGEARLLTDLHILVGFARSFPERLPAEIQPKFARELSHSRDYAFLRYEPESACLTESDIAIQRQYVCANQIRKDLARFVDEETQATANNFFCAVADVILRQANGGEDHSDRCVWLHQDLLPKLFSFQEGLGFLRALH